MFNRLKPHMWQMVFKHMCVTFHTYVHIERPSFVLLKPFKGM
jgi:hypothetical protein